MRVARGLCALSALAVLCVPVQAFATTDTGIQAYQNSYRWYGVSGKTWSYAPWDAYKHVSSLYVHAPGWAEWNYVEAGIVAPHDDYAQAFVAYENFPDTAKYDDHVHRDQVRVYGTLQPNASWVYCEINNHTLGGSNWYAAAGGQTLLHGLQLWLADYSYPYTRTACPQGDLRTTAERFVQTGYGTDNRMSTAYLKMKDSSGNWYDWNNLYCPADLAPWDRDSLWDPYKVHNRYWYTVEG